MEYFSNRRKTQTVGLPLSGYEQMMLPSIISLKNHLPIKWLPLATTVKDLSFEKRCKRLRRLKPHWKELVGRAGHSPGTGVTGADTAPTLTAWAAAALLQPEKPRKADFTLLISTNVQWGASHDAGLLSVPPQS